MEHRKIMSYENLLFCALVHKCKNRVICFICLKVKFILSAVFQKSLT